jgi:hypothetical protein
MLRLCVALSLVSLAAMILIDRTLGSRAGFLNAWSVVERLLGRVPTAGRSVVAEHMGAAGELVAVVVANVVIGTVLAAVVRLVAGLAR